MCVFHRHNWFIDRRTNSINLLTAVENVWKITLNTLTWVGLLLWPFLLLLFALPLTHLQLFLTISTNTSSLFFCLHAAGLFSSPRCRTWSPGSRSFLTAASCVLVIATRLALFLFDLSSDQTTSSTAPLPPSLPAPRPPALALQRFPLCFTPSNSFRPDQFNKCLLTRLPVLVSVFI